MAPTPMIRDYYRVSIRFMSRRPSFLRLSYAHKLSLVAAIPLILAVLGVAILAQSLNLETVVDSQASVPYALIQPLGMVLFFVAGLAELGRTPFDIHPAE